MNRAAQLSSRTFLFRKPIENKLSMKLSFSVFAVSAVGASAWLQPTTTTHGMSRSEMRRQYSKGVITQFSGSALGSTCTPEEVTTVSALTATGKPIAEGTLVSFFRGGLVAIRVDDDDIQLPAESFDVMEATDSNAKTSKTADLSKFFSVPYFDFHFRLYCFLFALTRWRLDWSAGRIFERSGWCCCDP